MNKYIAIIEKSTMRVLEVLSNESESLIAMASYNGKVTRARAPEEVARAYSNGKEIYAHTDWRGVPGPYGMYNEKVIKYTIKSGGEIGGVKES